MQSLLNSYGLNMTRVCWEDTARSKGSCWGPNISDMTLRSNGKDCQVIRRPNFADITVDHSLDHFNVTVGNENGTELKRISLREYLDNLNVKVESDEKVLCSTQACILEGDSGDVPFNVRLYNYQTTETNPAILVIISTNQGTSAQVLDAKTTDVLFNKNGRAHDFIAERLKEERKRLGKSLDTIMSTEEKERNIIFIYQVPLVVPRPTRGFYSNNKIMLESFNCKGMDSATLGYDDDSFAYEESCSFNQYTSFPAPSGFSVMRGISKGFDNAMLKVSSNDKGPFTGTKGKTLTRDTNYPIRCTLQYYWITDDMSMLNEPLVKIMGEQLEKFYSNSENKSSLVMGKTERPTEPKNMEQESTPSNLPSPFFQVQMNSYAY
jgi:hypothetical protein